MAEGSGNNRTISSTSATASRSNTSSEEVRSKLPSSFRLYGDIQEREIKEVEKISKQLEKLNNLIPKYVKSLKENGYTGPIPKEYQIEAYDNRNGTHSYILRLDTTYRRENESAILTGKDFSQRIKKIYERNKEYIKTGKFK